MKALVSTKRGAVASAQGSTSAAFARGGALLFIATFPLSSLHEHPYAVRGRRGHHGFSTRGIGDAFVQVASVHGLPHAVLDFPGDLSAPRWAVYAQPGNAISVGGATLVVREGEQFVIGVMSTVDQKIKRYIRCAVTWSGWRPQMAPGEASGQPSASRQ